MLIYARMAYAPHKMREDAANYCAQRKYIHRDDFGDKEYVYTFIYAATFENIFHFLHNCFISLAFHCSSFFFLFLLYSHTVSVFFYPLYPFYSSSFKDINFLEPFAFLLLHFFFHLVGNILVCLGRLTLKCPTKLLVLHIESRRFIEVTLLAGIYLKFMDTEAIRRAFQQNARLYSADG